MAGGRLPNSLVSSPKSPLAGIDGSLVMLTRLKITGFKSLSQLEIEPALVNVFIGANGSGKSNILEAIGLLGAAAGGRVDDEALLRRGVRPGIPALYKTALKAITISPAIYLEAAGKGDVLYKAGINNPLGEPKPAWAYKTETVSVGGRDLLTRGPTGGQLSGLKWGVSKEFAPSREGGLAALARGTEDFAGPPAEFLDALSDFAIFAPVTPVLRGIAPDPAPRAPVGLFGGRLPEAVSPLLDQKKRLFGRLRLRELFTLLEWAEDLSISAPSRSLLSPSVSTSRFVLRFQDRRMTRNRNLLSGYDASEGALYVLFMLVLAMHPEAPRVLAVDNFDAALNPLLAKSMTTIFVGQLFASNNDRQVFLTTHQPQGLDGLDLTDPRIRLFVVERDKRAGNTLARRIEINPKLLEQGGDKYSLSRLWTMGRLGGVPQL
jgi:energy-coupling factor transporter ATP-binding protein EcfA2